LRLTFTSLDLAGHSLIPVETVTSERSVRVCADRVCTAVARSILTFIDIFVTVRSGPATVKIATRRTTSGLITHGLFTTTVVLAVPTPAIGRTH